MITRESLAENINQHAATDVVLHGDIDASGVYRGAIEGSSPDEINEFLRYIAVTRGRDFDCVRIRYGRPLPPTVICNVEFDTKEIIGKESYIIIPCKYCGARIQAESRHAGRVASCPNCGQDIVIGLNRKSGPPPLLVNTPKDSVSAPKRATIDISNVYFRSTDHKRYNSGIPTGVNNKGCNRAIEIKSDATVDNSYIVTLYNLDDVHPDWGDNIQIAPKRMKIIESSEAFITLRGFGSDPMLSSRPPQIQENFGISIHLRSGEIDHISYYYHDRDVRLDFLK